MKKYIALTCVLIALLLAACQPSGNPGGTTEGTTAPQITTIPEDTTAPDETTVPQETDPAYVDGEVPQVKYLGVLYNGAVYDDNDGGIVPGAYELAGSLTDILELYVDPNNNNIDLFVLDTAAHVSYKFTPAEPFAVESNSLAHFQTLLSDREEAWYGQAATSIFASPAEIDLYAFFYNGIPGESADPTEEENQFLQTKWDEGYWADGQLESDLVRLPVDKMNELLQKYLGITLDQTNGTGLDSLTYWEETGCYYGRHGDASIWENSTVTEVTTNADGAYQVRYTDHTDGGEYIITLMPSGGGYLILSNLPA